MTPEPASLPDHVRTHRHRHVHRAEVRAQYHGTHAVGRFNNRVATVATRSVGTMWCAYLFMGIALVSLPAAIRSGDPIVIVAWVAQTFIQLVLLPVIIVGQNLQSEATARRAEQDHETLTILHEINVHQTDLLEQQRAILTLLQPKGGSRARRGL